MEMKLSGTRIKELRLKLSWSQEKLAEQAGLNPRTVQRAESEGSASLRTRLQLAQAQQVLPQELDAEPAGLGAQPMAGAAPGHSGTNIYYFAVLLLVSIVYVTAQPAYFSLSIVNFSWINYGQINYGGQADAEWWVLTLSLWALLCLPVLLYLYRKHQHLFLPYLAGFGIGLALALLKGAKEALVADLLTALVSLSGLALLLSLYLPRLDTRRMRHVVCMSLAAYLFVWCIQSVGYIALQLYMDTFVFGREIPLWHAIWFILIRIGDHLANLPQLIPVLLVFALSLGKRPDLHGKWPVIHIPINASQKLPW